jgi:hypothetical protein
MHVQFPQSVEHKFHIRDPHAHDLRC